MARPERFELEPLCGRDPGEIPLRFAESGFRLRARPFDCAAATKSPTVGNLPAIFSMRLFLACRELGSQGPSLGEKIESITLDALKSA